jgi:hypothetical protein
VLDADDPRLPIRIFWTMVAPRRNAMYILSSVAKVQRALGDAS